MPPRIEENGSALSPVYPWPKIWNERPGRFALRDGECIQFPFEARDPICLFREDVRTAFGVNLRPARTGRIVFSADPRMGRESYRLEVDPVSVRLAYGGPSGLLYGLDTLQSLMARAGWAGVVIPACRIEDEPYKPLRGIHLYMPGRDNLVFFKRLLRYLVRLRLNTVFLEIGGGLEFKRHPEINSAWEAFVRVAGPFNADAKRRIQESQGFEKDSVHPELGGGSFITQAEAKELAAEAARLGIDIIPEVQSLSHCYWLCMAHPEIAERREDPFPDTYCPSNPRSYDLLFDALTEVIAVFRPRMIAIGHDEWYSIGLCPRCRKKSGAALFLADVKKISSFLKARGVQTCIWGDKLLNFRGDDGKRYGGIARRATNPKTGFPIVRPATHAALKRFPRDILIGHWYYSLSRDIDRTLVRRGLNFIFANFNPTIFQNWAGRGAEPRCRGGEMSTWVKVSETVFAVTGQLPLMALGANMLWSDRTASSAPVPARARLGAIDSGTGQARARGSGRPAYRALARAAAALRRHIHGGLLPSERAGARIVPVKLDAWCTVKAADRLDGLSFDLKAGMAGLKKNGLTRQGIPFRFSKGARSAIGIALGSDDRLAIPMRGTAKALVFLHALHARRAPAASYGDQRWEAHTAAVYRLVYADGSFAEQPAVICQALGLLKRAFGVEPLARPFPAFPAWTDSRHTLYAYEWVNPHPERPIARLMVEGTGASGDRYRLAPTGSGRPRGGVLIVALSRVS